MKVKIRKTNPEDWKIIQKLNNQVFLADSPHDQHLNLNWPFQKQGIDYYKKVTSSNKYFCIIAEIDNQPVSYLVGMEQNYSYRSNRAAEIENMGTLPSYRSKGIGSKLVAVFKEWCKHKEITHIRVSAYSQNKQAIKFYKKHGLQPIDIIFEGKIT